MQAVESNVVSYAKVGADARTAADTADRIDWIKLSLTYLPLATPVSDAKVLTGAPEGTDRDRVHLCRDPHPRRP